MKKIIVLSLILLASVTLAGCGTKNQSITPEVKQTPAGSSKESFIGTLEQLMAKGKTAKCTSVIEANGVKTESEFYVDGAGGRSKIISKMTQADKVQTTNMILTKETIYFWQAGQNQGFKYPVTKPTTTNEPTATDKNLPGAEKQNESYNFNCEAWNIDASIFTVPTDVNFVDQATMLKNLQEKAGGRIPANVNIPKY